MPVYNTGIILIFVMPELNDLETQLMEDLAKDKVMLHKFFVDYKEKIDDLRLVKNTVNLLMNKIGMRNEDGTPRQNIKISAIAEIIMKSTDPFHRKQFQKEWSFIGELMPLIEKYKDL